jgi:hypothetical protein
MNQRPSKSPFILQEDFIPFEQCEDIVLSLKHTLPNRDMKNTPIRTIKTNQLAEIRLTEKLDALLDVAEQYYGFSTLNISPFKFEWLAEGYKSEPPRPDNASYFDGKWVKSKDFDFTVLIFLGSSKNSSIRDTLMESFGGKVEFLNHQLTIIPKAGTMLMFPSNDYFINTYTDVAMGNMNVIRIHITAQTPFVYDKNQYPGDYRTWF